MRGRAQGDAARRLVAVGLALLSLGSAAPSAAAETAGAGQATRDDLAIEAPPTLRMRLARALEAVDGVVAPVFDVIVLRPLGAAATVVGVPFFVVSAPFVAPSGGLRRSFDLFVYEPVDYTFVRPLGEF